MTELPKPWHPRVWTVATVAFAAVIASAMSSFANAQSRFQAQSGVVLQGLDKVTARISTIRAPIEVPISFGSLEIVARTCHETPPEEPPERAAFLEIRDIRPGEAPIRVFSGWMFASSPALSALEHPVYDVWVVDCMKDSSSSSPSSR